MPTLDILIVNWNTADYLARCLDSIAATTQQRAFDIVTTVVDNGSADNSVTLIHDQYPWVKLIANRDNVGFAPANNQAVRQTSGEFVLLLNSDTQLHTGALDHLMAFMLERPLAGAVGARLLNADGTLQIACSPMLTPLRELWRLSFLDRLLPRATYQMQQWDSETPRQVEVIKGACLLLRRRALDEVGLLDSRYFMYTEEVDICYRLADVGWQLWYEPRAAVTHFGGASSAQMPVQMYVQLHRSKVQFYRKMGGRPRALLFKAVMLIAYLPRLLLQPSNPAYRQLIRTIPSM